MKKKDISKAFEISKSTKCSCIKMFYCRNEKNWNRIAVVLKKGYGNSVERNRIKRVIKEVYRKIKEFLPCGQDFLFLPLTKNSKYLTIERDIVSLFRQAGIADVSGKVV